MINCNKKTIAFLLAACLYCASVSAQVSNGFGSHGPGPRDWWYTLEQGKLMFRLGNYSDALLTFDDARRQRRTMYEQMEHDLIAVLSLSEVRRLGDSLDWIEQYIQDRRYDDAGNALKELFYRVPRDNFNNSIAAVLKAFDPLKDYPEAEYWIGETYLVEGELQLALTQFRKAYSLRNHLENADFATELLYKIASINRIRQEYTEMERVLQSILNTDPMWIGGGGNATSYARAAMSRTLENDDINRFLSLYRHRDGYTVQAHRILGYYYYGTGRFSRAQEHFMFSFLIQNTIIIDEIKRYRFDFGSPSGKPEKPLLEQIAAEIKANPILSEYAAKNDYFRNAYYLGSSLYSNGKTQPAKIIWNFLASQDAGEWQVRSITQLRNPRVGE